MMLKKALCLVLSICIVIAGFVICPFPVNAGIDPEPEWLLPVADTYIDQSNPASNYGNEGTVAVYKRNPNAAANTKIAFMKFDISNIDFETLNTASVRIYAKFSRANTNDQLNVYAMEDTDWIENTITWEDAPVNDVEALATYTLLANFKAPSTIQYKFYSINVKDYLIEQKSNGKSFISLVFATPATFYSVSIYSKENEQAEDCLPYLIINEDKISPTAPQNFSAEAISTEEIELEWEASTDNVAVSGYEIYKDGELTQTVESNVLSYIIGGLQPSTTYSFYLKAVDTSLNQSEASVTATARTLNLTDGQPPSIPPDLNANVLSSSRVKLTWGHSTDNIGIQGYAVFCDGEEIAMVNEAVYMEYVAGELSAGTEYTFSVEAIDFEGNRSGQSVGVTVTTLSDPVVETVWLLPIADAQINQAKPDSNYNYGSVYTTPGDVGLFYTYLRNPSSAANTNIVYMKFDINDIDTDVINKAEVRIYAKDSRVNTIYDFLNVYGVSDVSWSEDTLTWSNAPVNDFSGTEAIESKMIGTTDFNEYYFDITDYVKQEYDSGKTHITLAFQPKNSFYGISMEGRDRVGGDDQNPNPPYLVINRDTSPPEAPRNLSTEAVSTEAIKLTWEASTDDIAVAGYEVYRDGEKVATTEANVTEYTCIELVPSTTYSFYVKAVDASQNISAASETVTGRTLNLPDDEAPSKPQNLNGVVISNKKVRLAWESSTDNISVEGYIIYCNGSEIASVSANANIGYEIASLSRGTTYTFSVAAFDVVGNISELSDVITLTTLNEADTQPPDKPTNLQMGDLSVYSSQAILTWAPSPDNTETAGYIIYINGFEKARVDGDTTSYQLTGLTPYTEYRIYIKAFDNAGNMSEASDTLTEITGYVTMRTVGQGKEYSTISAALSAANPGDVVLVYDGEYTESLTIDKSGSSVPEKWITVRAEGDAALLRTGVMITGSYIRFAGFTVDGLVDGNYASTHGARVSGTHVQLVDNKIINIKQVPFYCERTSNNIYIAGNYTNKTRGFITSYASDSIFEGNEIVSVDIHGSTSGDMDYFRIFGQNVIIRNNYAHDTVNGPHIGGAHLDYFQAYDDSNDISKNILIENNIFTTYCHQGFMLSNATKGPDGTYLVSDWTVRNNVFAGFDKFAVCAAYGYENGGVPNLTFENNVFYGDPATGSNYGVILANKGTSGVIRNNIIMNVSGPAYGGRDGAIITEADNNLVYQAEAPSVPGINDIIGMDPLFVDHENGNFHLQPASPAIDMGTMVSFSHDLEGKVRPLGNGIDIGPYEFDGVKVNNAPIITILSPSRGQGYATGSAANITVNARDDEEVVRVEYYVDGNYVGESAQPPFNYEISSIGGGMHTLYAIAHDENGLSTRSGEVIFFVTDTTPVTGDTTWKNITINPQNGIMSASFSAIPMVNNMSGIIGLTLGDADVFDDIAVIVRFNTNGRIDAINGKSYNADNSISYTVGNKYDFNVIVDIPNHTFSVLVSFVNNDGVKTTQAVCSNYAFRNSMKEASSLNRMVACADVGYYFLLDYTAGAYVHVEAESVVMEEEMTIEIGTPTTIIATILPTNSTNKVLVWESSDPSVATVDQNGTVTGVSAGTAVIKATVDGTSIFDECVVTVGGYAFQIEDTSIDKEAGIAVAATVTAKPGLGGDAVVIFKLMKTDDTVIGLYSSELYIEDDSVFKVKFHGYSGDEYKVKIFVWDRLDNSTDYIGVDLAVPAVVQ